MAAKTVTGVLQPKITVPGMPGFLLWARRDSPRLYGALVAKFPVVWRFEEAMKNLVDPSVLDNPGLGDFSDIMSSLGGAISSAAGSIGSFVMNNAPALLTTAGSVFVATQQAKTAQAQAALATYGRPPAQTAYVTNAQGQSYPVPVQANQAGGYNPYYAASMPPSGIMANLASVPMTTWLLGGGALIAVLLLLKRT